MRQLSAPPSGTAGSNWGPISFRTMRAWSPSIPSLKAERGCRAHEPSRWSVRSRGRLLLTCSGPGMSSELAVSDGPGRESSVARRSAVLLRRDARRRDAGSALAPRSMPAARAAGSRGGVRRALTALGERTSDRLSAWEVHNVDATPGSGR
jgi:hypothetical protein